ncbi:hypothetical protein CP97_01415 [Aurantiacibacter atlanticus]|uniref:Uncharacterized protein n=1 Tax=Aurantiacibacter atlanticus TaxID=1648404 RepID=A0A0H4V915_9SPHN|nr:hypothetical protein [Aurantiacibacter atlanticus]AKQ40995.1 hypothetical protein CP97_01415 [Aurantiacibacter atlanticus]
MAGLGFGFGARSSNGGGGKGRQKNATPLVAPVAAWNGTAGSGFSSAPEDPARTTAKPACRLLVVPWQVFTDELTVGVFAAASNGGTLLDNLGLEKVIFHFEGASVDVLAPTYHSFIDANGSTVKHLGWWATLKRPAGHVGDFDEANLYVEAVPSDAAMQRRVVGPYVFLPSATLHDGSVTVAPSGADFTTLQGALDATNSAGYKNPRITFTGDGNYQIVLAGGAAAGWNTIDAAPGVTATIVGPDNPDFEGLSGKGRQRINGTLKFTGSGIVIDMAEYIELYPNHPTRYPWFDGCRITDSKGFTASWRGRHKANFVGWAIKGESYFTECEIDNLFNCPDDAVLARGIHVRDCYNDVFNDALCVVGCRVEDHDGRFWNDNRLAMTVTYTGPEATAYIQRTSSVGGIRINWGANSADLTIGTTEADYAANTNYSVRNVVDFINSYSADGWSATLIDDTHWAASLCKFNKKGAGFSATNVKDATLSLYTAFDIHADIYQRGNSGTLENVVVYGNYGHDIVAQDLFFAGAMRDTIAINNAFHNKTDASTSIDLASQLNSAHSHVVVAHNTLASQRFVLRNDLNYDPDAYCLFANNSIKSFTWSATADADLEVADNHFISGSVPAGSVGTTIGGSTDTLYTDAANGNFTPAGDLLTNSAGPLAYYDFAGETRKGQAAKGALD